MNKDFGLLVQGFEEVVLREAITNEYRRVLDELQYFEDNKELTSTTDTHREEWVRFMKEKLEALTNIMSFLQ